MDIEMGMHEAVFLTYWQNNTKINFLTKRSPHE